LDEAISFQPTDYFGDLEDWNYELPMLAVYETIDLGLVSSLSRMSGLTTDSSSMTLLQGNHPVFHTDPIHDDTVYVYHAFGVHALYLGPMLQAFTAALRTAMRDTEDGDTDGTELIGALLKCGGTNVQPILTTFSVERKYVFLIAYYVKRVMTYCSGVQIQLSLSQSRMMCTWHTAFSSLRLHGGYAHSR